MSESVSNHDLDPASEAEGERLASVRLITEAPSLHMESFDPLQAEHEQQLMLLESREKVARAAFNDWASRNDADVSGDVWRKLSDGMSLDVHTLHAGVDLELAWKDAVVDVSTFRNTALQLETKDRASA